MDFLTALPLPLALAVLALVDGLSIGTLLIPLFLVLAPGKPRVRRILLYLTTITGFYLLVGLLFMLGIVSAIHIGRDFLASTAGHVTLLLVGVALFATALGMWAADSQRKKRIAAGENVVSAGDDRLLRWREKLLDERTSGLAVMGVALTAGIIEVASMLPYLIGMTMLADAPLSPVGRSALLVGYCIVMIVPAVVLLGARALAARAVERPLQRFADWMRRTGSETTSWLFGIVGFLLVRAGASQLGIQLPFIG